jgi:hypothetical protein
MDYLIKKTWGKIGYLKLNMFIISHLAQTGEKKLLVPPSGLKKNPVKSLLLIIEKLKKTMKYMENMSFSFKF